MNAQSNAKNVVMSEAALISELRMRLAEAEETLDAIRNGEVDAVVIGGPNGQRVYALENADRPYRVLIEQMQEGAITLGEDGTILYCNDRFAQLLRRRREQIIGHLVTEYLSAEDIAPFQRLLGRRDLSRAAELTLTTPEGGGTPVNISLAGLVVEDHMPPVLCGVVTDLTHSRQRSHELVAANTQLAREIDERRRAEESLQIALDAAGMGNWDIDLLTGVLRQSQRYQQILGSSSSPADGNLHELLQLFVPEDRAAVGEAFAAAEHRGSVEFEKRIRRNDDQAIRWVHLRGQTYVRDGKPVRIAGVIADVTDRRLIDEQLRQAQKMEAIGQLTGGIAHDFNNLLMVIGGSLDMLDGRIHDDERVRRCFAAARLGVQRGAKLNQQLLAFSRRQDLHMKAICVDDLLSTFQILLDRAIGETVTVVIKSAPHVWFCKTDPHQLETAILNLAINARDAMPSGGSLTLSTGIQRIDDTAAARLDVTAAEYVVVEVSDTGSGMSQHVLNRVFEPFFTTKDVGRGTGLGLSQVYGFARQSGGFVAIDSTLGVGTSVKIYLPKVAATDSDEETTSHETGNLRGSGNILLVEDDADVRAVTRGMLEELGYSVAEAGSAAEALDQLQRGASVDLVFTDVIMPGGMSGVQLAAELKIQRPTLAVLLCSGYTAQHLSSDFSLGDIELLRKPYTVEQLSRSINTAMHKGPQLATLLPR